MFDIRWQDGAVVLSGRFDASQADKAEAFLAEIHGPASLDLHDLRYISSLGLGILLKTQKRLAAGGGGLRLVRVNRHVGDVLHFSGFDRIFEIEVEE